MTITFLQKKKEEEEQDKKLLTELVRMLSS